MNENRGYADPYLSCCFLPDKSQLVTGNRNGDIYQWKDGKILNTVKGNGNPIWQLISYKDSDETKLLAGQNGKIAVWEFRTQKLQPQIEINLAANADFLRPDIRSLDYSPQSKKILAGTRGSEIIEIDETHQKQVSLVKGHYSASKNAELWGVACHPKD